MYYIKFRIIVKTKTEIVKIFIYDLIIIDIIISKVVPADPVITMQ